MELAVGAAGMIVRSAIGTLVRASVQLQGARGLDLERASSEDTSDEQVPELRLNICLVSEVFVQILATGVGTIAFIWATVVLLGGFSTFLHKVDFWVITGIVFVQAAKVVGVNSNTEAKFFAQVPPAFLELGVKHFTGRRSPLMGDASGRNLCSYIIQGLLGARDVIGYMALLTLVLLLVPMVAASSCIGLSIFRLFIITRHKQYRDSGDDNSKGNVLRALIFFYALVLAQGGLFLICMCILVYRSVVREQVCSEYHLEGKDQKLIDKYIDRTSSACIRTGVLNTINRNLVSFAIDLLHSEYREDRISGVQVLHTLTSVANETHNERTITHIQSSPDCIARMLVLLNSKSGIDENSKVNLALIVTKICKELRLRDIDGATESISSLIDPYLTQIFFFKANLTNVSTPAGSVSNVSQQGISQPPNVQNEENLIIHGLEILSKLAGKNPDNCTKIFSTKDLFPKIIAPISNKLYTVITHDGSTIKITEKSLRVVSKLVKGKHGINREIRHEICGKGLVVDVIHPILKSEQIRYNKLKVPAIKVLSQLDLVDIVGDDADARVNYIHDLMGLLFKESNDIDIKKAAAKALVLLAEDSRTTHYATIMNWSRTTHCATIMNWSGGASHSVVVQQLWDCVLHDHDHSHQSYRNSVAQLLTQFCVHSTDAETRAFLKSILHEVLNVIICEVNKALGITDQQPNSQQQNRRPCEVILQLCAPPCIRQGAPATTHELQALFPCLGTSSPANQSGGGSTFQNHTVAGSQNPTLSLLILRLLNSYINVPGTYSKTQPSSTPIKAGSRKTLVAFLALALQIIQCYELSDEAAFDAAVSDGAELVDKLDKIIGMCNKDSVGLLKGRGPSVDYLMMFKSATKLCAWVMRAKPSYVEYFQEKNMNQKLEDALEAMKGLELGVLLTYSADELTNYQTLSSIVEDARRLIPSPQTTPPSPRAKCCCMFAV